MRTLSRVLVVCVCFFSGLGAASAQIEEADFIQRMVAHKVGVEILCTEFLARAPQAKALSSNVRGMLQLRCLKHDASKVTQDAKFLERHKLSKEKSIASYLAEIYGRYIPETQLDRGIIDTANRVDTAVAREIDLPFNATAAERRTAYMLEHVLDLTERGLHEDLVPPLNGVYERSRKMTPASQYFAENLVEAKNWTATERREMIAIAERFESNEALKLKLIKGVLGKEVDRRTAALTEASHFQKRRAQRAKCFEALLEAP